MATALLVRDATADDGAACAAIYRPYVTDTAISFETEPPDDATMTGRIAEAQSAYAWLVLERDGRVVGYAYGSPFHPRAAYRWSAQVSVYLKQGCHSRGGGRLLYEALLARLTDRGYRTAVGGMTLPNEASERLHRAMGFELVGTYRNIGWKHDAWHDVAWMSRPLGSVGPPAELE